MFLNKKNKILERFEIIILGSVRKFLKGLEEKEIIKTH